MKYLVLLVLFVVSLKAEFIKRNLELERKTYAYEMYLYGSPKLRFDALKSEAGIILQNQNNLVRVRTEIRLINLQNNRYHLIIYVPVNKMKLLGLYNNDFVNIAFFAVHESDALVGMLSIDQSKENLQRKMIVAADTAVIKTEERLANDEAMNGLQRAMVPEKFIADSIMVIDTINRNKVGIKGVIGQKIRDIVSKKSAETSEGDLAKIEKAKSGTKGIIGKADKSKSRIEVLNCTLQPLAKAEKLPLKKKTGVCITQKTLRPQKKINSQSEEKTIVKGTTVQWRNDEVANIILSESVYRWPGFGTKVLSAEFGVGSYYAEQFHLKSMACGLSFNMNSPNIAAHKTLPFGTVVRVTNLDNSQSVIVIITDRGPYKNGRVIDLSAAAAREIGLALHNVRLDILRYGNISADKFRLAPDVETANQVKKELERRQGLARN